MIFQTTESHTFNPKVVSDVPLVWNFCDGSGDHEIIGSPCYEYNGLSGKKSVIVEPVDGWGKLTLIDTSDDQLYFYRLTANGQHYHFNTTMSVHSDFTVLKFDDAKSLMNFMQAQEPATTQTGC